MVLIIIIIIIIIESITWSSKNHHIFITFIAIHFDTIAWYNWDHPRAKVYDVLLNLGPKLWECCFVAQQVPEISPLWNQPADPRQIPQITGNHWGLAPPLNRFLSRCLLYCLSQKNKRNKRNNEHKKRWKGCKDWYGGSTQMSAGHVHRSSWSLETLKTSACSKQRNT